MTINKNFTSAQVIAAINKFVAKADECYQIWTEAKEAGYVGANCTFTDIDSDVKTALSLAAKLDTANGTYREHLLEKIDLAMQTCPNDCHMAWSWKF